MELSLLTKCRIAAAIAIGVILIGFLARPLVLGTDPLAPITIPAVGSAALLVLIAFLTGLIAGFVVMPYSVDIGILAVPAGLAVWAFRSGSVGSAMQQTVDWQQRQALLLDMRFEPLFWLLLVAAGLAGALTAARLTNSPRSDLASCGTTAGSNPPKTVFINPAMAIVASTVIAIVGIRLLNQSETIRTAIVQPFNAQIAFAVTISFALAAFVVRHFLKVGYIYTIASSIAITLFSTTAYAKESVLKSMASTFPANCLPAAILGVLPIQAVAFGTLGAILGYWSAISFDYWRKQEMIKTSAN